MRRRLVFDQDGWSDYAYWQATDRATLKRINKLIDALRARPVRGDRQTGAAAPRTP